MFEKLVAGVSPDKDELKALETCRGEAKMAVTQLRGLLADNARRASLLAAMHAAVDEVNGPFRQSKTKPLEAKSQEALLDFLVKGPKAVKACDKAHKAIDSTLGDWTKPVATAAAALGEAAKRLVDDKGAPTKDDKHLDDPAGVIRKFLSDAKPAAEKQLAALQDAAKTVAALVRGIRLDAQFPAVKALQKAVG